MKQNRAIRWKMFKVFFSRLLCSLFFHSFFSLSPNRGLNEWGKNKNMPWNVYFVVLCLFCWREYDDEKKNTHTGFMANGSAKASIEKVWFVFLILCIYANPMDICLWLINTNFYRTYHFVIHSKTWSKFNLNKLWHRFLKSKYKPFKCQFIHILIAKWMMMKAMVFMNVPLYLTEQHKTFIQSSIVKY